ncbi:MAG: hypothetical protein HDT44_01225 [Ruminococcaceae bacterium]|nr:hypothetical protein [Oscillospiraceae bacterium]
MANEKIITLDLLETYKNNQDKVIADGDALAYKAVDFKDNTIKFYKTTDKSDTAFEVTLPAEIYLDQTKTVIEADFEWSDTKYPGSTDPDLDGEPVLVLAVIGEDAVTYSFLSMKLLVDVFTGEETDTTETTVSADNKVSVAVKISENKNNALQVTDDGLFVAKTEEAEWTYATQEDIDNLFA